MAEFDPYYKWFGIKPEHQPPHYYRLLGVELFEGDPDVIDSASDQRMKFLYGCSDGEHVELAHRMMNEVSKARMVLLDNERRTRYDAKLRKQLGQKDEPVAKETQVVKIDAGPIEPLTQRKKKKQSNAFAIAMGVSLLVLIGVAVKFLGGGNEVEPNGQADKTSAKSADKKSVPKVADVKSASVGETKKTTQASNEKIAEADKPDPLTEPVVNPANVDLDEARLGPEVDLLADVDVDADKYDGTWELKEGLLASTDETGGRLCFNGDLPFEYNLRLVARRSTPEGGIGLRLATPDIRFTAYLEAVAPNKDCFYGLGQVDGLERHRNVTSKRRLQILKDDAENVVDVVVRSDRIQVIVNGRLAIDYTGNQKALTLNNGERNYPGWLQLIALNSGLQVSQFTLRTKTTLPTLPKAPTNFTDATKTPAPKLTRLPIPSDDELKAARLVLAKELNLNPKNRSAADTLWSELIKRSESESRPPAQQYEALQLAAELARTVRSMDWMTQATMRAIRAFEIDEWSARLQAVKGASNMVTTPEDFKKQFKSTIDEALANNEFAVATELTGLALTIAKKSRNRVLIAEATAGRKLVTDLRREHEKAKAAAGVLAQTPDDELANLMLGKYLCLRKANWPLGLKFLAKSGDSQLRDFAVRDLALPSTAAEQIALAEDVMKYVKSPRGKSASWLVMASQFWLERAKGLTTATESEQAIAARLHEKIGTLPIKRSDWLDAGPLPVIGFSVPMDASIKLVSTTDRISWARGRQAQPAVQFTDGFAILLEVSGNFVGGGEAVGVYPFADGQWKIYGQAVKYGVSGVGSTVRVTQPGTFCGRMLQTTWAREHRPRRLMHSSQGFCFLRYVRGGFRGAGEHAWLSLDGDGYWYIQGTNAGHAVSVACMQIPGFKAEYKLHKWSKGQPPVRLIHKDDGFACLSGIGGAFHGGGESARVQLCDDGYWYLYGRSAQPSMVVHAVTVRQLNAPTE
jgi:hypothetical protein